MLDLNAIKAFFAPNPEADQADAEYNAWQAEQSEWETKAYNEKISTEEFNRVRDAIDIKYGYTPTSKLLAK